MFFLGGVFVYLLVGFVDVFSVRQVEASAALSE